MTSSSTQWRPIALTVVKRTNSRIPIRMEIQCIAFAPVSTPSSFNPWDRLLHLLFSMASNSAQASMVTLQLPGYGGPEDEGFWKDYFKGVTDEDNRKITNWQKSLDTLLVYVCFFFGGWLPHTLSKWLRDRLDSSSGSWLPSSSRCRVCFNQVQKMQPTRFSLRSTITQWMPPHP